MNESNRPIAGLSVGRWHELRPREPEITMEYLDSDR